LQDTLKDWFLELAEIAFSGSQNADNLLTRCLVLAEKIAPTKLGTFETCISRLGKIAFSGLKNEVP